MSKNIEDIKEKRREMFREYSKTKDENLRAQLIEEHLYLAEILSKKYSGKGIEYEDIFQVASMALIYAVDRYDIEKGYEFSSFATPTIIGEIKKYFRDKGWTIRVPRRIQELSKKITIARTDLTKLNQETPTVADIANYLGVTEEEVLESMEASKVYLPQSLDISYTNDGDNETNLADFIGQDERYYDQIEINDFIEKSMEVLNEVEKTVLIDRYFNKKTQREVGEKLEISQMTVSRIEKKALKRLKREMENVIKI
ncbi:SigB/SigF/SigG family RNA polymerase sigma factor [Peptoniphilus stercorisuis]|uniref:RNA polymerase sigma-B factor n=1 Tax=Peptoniphilus stercorisuis TaxID=1436965 RepID=A0ABS4KE66_9FIRM|nr:SigB/SigF/SigG family RNA polymerase sigma factor [Peptoniphilus stercorisuis]MBP2025566.1 RNA polymerase sigma-B factor [Peptoniphilus stercorisuis]